MKLIAKQNAASHCIQYLKNYKVIGFGTGSTVDILIEKIAQIDNNFTAISSSNRTTALLNKNNIEVLEISSIKELPIYIDGADQINKQFQMIKGGGGAATNEKILATFAKEFVCIADSSKIQQPFGEFPVAVEVLPHARSIVALELMKLGYTCNLRSEFITDNGNLILDVKTGTINEPIKLEYLFNSIPGVVDNGIFGKRCADKVIIGYSDNAVELEKYANYL